MQRPMAEAKPILVVLGFMFGIMATVILLTWFLVFVLERRRKQ
jgi:hypothetical protein